MTTFYPIKSSDEKKIYIYLVNLLDKSDRKREVFDTPVPLHMACHKTSSTKYDITLFESNNTPEKEDDDDNLANDFFRTCI